MVWRAQVESGRGGGGQSVIWKKPWVRQAVRMAEMRAGRGRERGIRGMGSEGMLSWYPLLEYTMGGRWRMGGGRKRNMRSGNIVDFLRDVTPLLLCHYIMALD